MKVVVYAVDHFACGHYRSIWPGEALAAQGMDVEVVHQGARSGIAGLKLGGRLASLQAPECDVIVLQRAASAMVADFIPALQKMGIAVVVDMDDDLERIHPSNPAFFGMHPTHSSRYNWKHAARACKEASLVTVSTPALLPRYGDHGRVRLLRNYVPQRFLTLEHDTSNAAIGWAGSLHSHPGDLDQTVMALARLSREGHELKFVGPKDGISRKLGVDLPNEAFTGETPLEDWIELVASRLGVGVAPLGDTSFNAAKSWLKPLEYSAAGVPWVASDTPEYRQLAKMCGAPLATKPKQWYRELQLLASNEDLRAQRSGAAREAASQLTIERNCHLWAEAWQAALDAERKLARR